MHVPIDGTPTMPLCPLIIPLTTTNEENDYVFSKNVLNMDNEHAANGDRRTGDNGDGNTKSRNVTGTKQGELSVPLAQWQAESTVAKVTLIVMLSENLHAL